MNRTIWKYRLQIINEQTIEMPEGARVLCVQTQGSTPSLSLWAVVDPNAPTSPRKFRTHGTGHQIADAERLVYIGTYQVQGGVLAFHVFEMHHD